MSRTRLLLSLLVLTGLVVGLVPGALGAPPPAIPEEPVVVRFYYDDQAHLDAVAGQLDVWEVHRAEHYAVAAVAPAEYRWLLDLGYRLEVDREKTALLGIDAPLDPRYYYFDDYYTNSNGRYVDAFLAAANAAYPDITELIDIGNAWQGENGDYNRDLWVLRITNEDPAYGPVEDKPVFFLHTEIHAREVSTPELAVSYIKYLTSGHNGQGGYGIDADVTWLVDWHTVYVEVMVNPDGHVENEMDTNAYRRKNMDNDDGCGDPDSWGVDLNRNHSFLWGCCGGSSGNPCSETYRGPARASEQETYYFQDFLMDVIPDQNGPNGDDEIPPAAPITTTGFLISLHSYQDEILWPWTLPGYPPAPNGAAMEAIARKMAAIDPQYEPTGSLYTVDGTTRDWSYGKLGIPSYVFEVGPVYGTCGGFFPPYGCVYGIDGMPRNFWAENLPVFLYAHKVTRQPYAVVYGPDTQNLAVSPDPVPQGTPADLTALIQDHRYGSDPLATVGAAEYFIDEPGLDGTGFAMAPQDGSWGGTSEWVTGTIDTICLAPGNHYVLVHGRKATTPNNYWGPFTARFFAVGDGCYPARIQAVVAEAAGCEVTFSADVSGTAPLSYTWDLGAWGQSSLPTLTVDFGSPGSYPYTLTVVNCPGHCADVAQGVVTIEPVGGADFSWEPPLPGPGELVTFTGVSSGTGPLYYDWDLGDGTTASGAQVGHVYASAGAYTVRMTVTNGCSLDTAAHTLQVCTPVQILNIITQTTGCSVDYAAVLSGTAPFDYDWDFGAFGSSAEPTPTVAYGLPGTYAYTLTVENCYGQYSDTVERTVSVDCCVPPSNAAFDYAPPNPLIGETVVFTGTVESNRPVTYTWDFGSSYRSEAPVRTACCFSKAETAGDGGTDSGAVVTHTYTAGGAYTVVMTATNPCGTAVASDVVVVGAPNIVVSAVSTPTLQPEATLQGELVISNTGGYTLSWTLAEAAPIDWLAESPMTGTTAPGGMTAITLYYTAPVTPSVYTGALHIASDDPDEPLVVVPVALRVVPAGCEPVQILTITPQVTGCAVSFTAEVTGTAPFAYLWAFGDGITSTLIAPTHTYTQTGTYSGTLDVWNCGGTGHDTDDFAVQVDCAVPPTWYVYLPVVFR